MFTFFLFTINLVPTVAISKKSNLQVYSRYYAEACSEWWDPSPQLSALTTQKYRRGDEPLATVSDLTGPEIEPQTSRADNDVFNHDANGLVQSLMISIIL